MKTGYRTILSVAALAGALASTGTPVQAVENLIGDPPAAAATGSQAAFSVLPGRWVRPDGGYAISIKSVAADGRLEAGYANPSQLPFSRAEATRDNSALKLFFELRAGGYNGSTYTLTYDPETDQLKGIYYQAVARQKYEVVFNRAK